MRRSLRNATLYARNLLHTSSNVNPNVSNSPLPTYTLSRLRFFSSESDSSGEKSNPPLPESPAETPDPVPESSADKPDPVPDSELKKQDLEDRVVSKKELKEMLENCFKGLGGIVRRSITERIMERRSFWNDEETDDEGDSDFDDLCETDKEIEDLYNAKEYAMEKMMKDEYFTMDDKKWDEMVKEAMEHGYIEDTRECEQILHDMINWDKVLPDDIKEKVEKKFNELGDKCERGELEAEKAYEQYKEFEDQIVSEYTKRVEAEAPPQVDVSALPPMKRYSDDPPGEGPVLRWVTRVVFTPGGEQWHPKNRKVKLSVTVKELGLSKHQFRRLRELVGRRYHPGKDELTITSERFEHREENRKDCLLTLYKLIEEAGKADKLADDAYVSFMKNKLRGNQDFMDRLHAKVMRQEKHNNSRSSPTCST